MLCVDVTLSSRRLAGCALLAAVSGGCTTWTSVHGGYGLAPKTDRSAAGLEVRRALGSSLHSGYGLVGMRLDGGEHQVDAEVHGGVMRPVRLADTLTFVPTATLELARVSRIDESWYGGAFGPGIGAELLWWLRADYQSYEVGPPFGCMGGAVGYDCPSRCQVEDVTRTGIGLRVAGEYDMRWSSSFPRMNDGVLWLTLGMTTAVSEREHECCYFAHERPRQGECTLGP
jgi:hypothetical protein